MAYKLPRLVEHAMDVIGDKILLWDSGKGPRYPACIFCNGRLSNPESDKCSNCGEPLCGKCRHSCGGLGLCVFCAIVEMDLVVMGRVCN